MWQFFVKGGPIMYPLLLCSLASITVIVERLIFWARERGRRDFGLEERILELAERGDYNGASQLGHTSTDYLARVLTCGIEHRAFSLVSALEMQGATELRRMRKHLMILDTIITVAPLFGILGTVVGILQTFSALGDAATIDTAKQVSAGIAVAVITTVAGLAIAIPSLLFYNYFLAKVDEAQADIEKCGTRLQILYERALKENRVQ